MNLLDQLMSGLGAKPSNMHGALNALFSGVPGGQNPGGVQGANDLPSLVRRFEMAGMGNIVHSWIAIGPNDGVTPAQVLEALGKTQVDILAAQTGLDETQILGLLAAELPDVVDRLTPAGYLPG